MDEKANGWLVEGNITVNCPSALLSHMNYNGGNTLRHNVFACHNSDLMMTFIRCEDHKLTDNTFHAEGAVIFAGREGSVTLFDNNRIYSGDNRVMQRYVSDDYEWSDSCAFDEPVPLVKRMRTNAKP